MNRPTIVERDNCAPYLVRELAALSRVRVIVALGAFGWDAAVRTISLDRDAHASIATPPEVRTRQQRRSSGAYQLIGSFHPSQRNTFTGRLTCTDAGSGPSTRGRARRDLTSAVLTAARRTSACPSAGMLA